MKNSTRRRIPHLGAALAVAALAWFVAAGCHSPGGSGDDGGLGPDWPGHPDYDPVQSGADEAVVDHPSLGRLTLVESELTLRVEGDAWTVVVPIDRAGGDGPGGAGTVSVAVRDIGASVTLVSGEAAVALAPGRNTATVTLAAPDGAAVAQAGRVFDCTLTVDKVMAHARRSVWEVLPQPEVLLVGPPAADEGTTGSVRLLARERRTGAVLPETALRLTVEGAGGARVVDVVTDASGSATVPLAFEEAGVVSLAATLAEGDALPPAEVTVQVLRDSRLLLTTDKRFYQPGQRMFLRALALRRPDLLPRAGEALVFEVFDAKGNKVFKEERETSAHGIAHASFSIGPEVNLGDWRVVATLGETATESIVQVKRYALPKFALETTLERPYQLVGEEVRGVVLARYFYGRAVQGGTVHIEAAAFDVEWRAFATVDGVTDDEGRLEFAVRLPDYVVGQPIAGGGALVQLDVEVTDGAGHTEQRLVPVTVVDRPIGVVVVPESGHIVSGIENRLFVFTQDPLGRPLPAHVSATGAGVALEVDTDASGFAELRVTPHAATLSLSVQAEALDGSGSARETVVLTAGAEGGVVLVRTDRALYDVGDTLLVEVRTAEAQDRVYLDVVRNGVAVVQQTLVVEDGIGGAALDLDETLTGDLLVEAYYLDEERGEIRRDTKRVWVRSAATLQVAIEPDRETYRPADPATVRFAVTDAAGAPAPAALGVQVVDEAVLAMSDVRPGLLEAYFRIEEAIATPRYQIKGADWDLGGLVREGDPADDATQAEAEAAFAALEELPLRGVARTDWESLAWQAVSTSHAALRSEQSRIERGAAAAARDGVAPGRLAGHLESLGLADPWGQRYDLSLDEYDWGPPDLVVVSSGMDEAAATRDDWSARFELTAFYTASELATAGYDEHPPSYDTYGGGWDDCPAAADAAGWWGEDTGGPPPEDGPRPRVRRWFPETLYVNPELITDDQGVAEVTFPLADSITTWRLTALASDLAGALGSREAGITVFQDFFVDIDVPAVLTRGDRVTLPLALYGYLDVPQTVRLEVELGDWAHVEGETTFERTIRPGEVTSVALTLVAEDVGWHSLTLWAYGDAMSDAVERTVLVEPDGQRFDETVSDFLRQGPTALAFDIPQDVVPGSPKVNLHVYPGLLAQAVDGMEQVFSMPFG